MLWLTALACTALALPATAAAKPRSRSRHVRPAQLVTPASSGASGEITGTVTSARGGTGIEGIEVCAYGGGEPVEEPIFEEEGEGLFGPPCVTTGAGGQYAISGLTAGSYIVEFSVPYNSPLNFQRQYYDGKSLESEAYPVGVPEGQVTAGIDAALQPGGEIAGLVNNTKSQPLAGIEVCDLEEGAEGFPERCTDTNAAGEYTIAGIAPGNHDVEFMVPFESNENYAPQYYDDASSRAHAKAVSVEVEKTAAGIDAELVPGGQITGTVTSQAGAAPLAEVEVCAWPVGEELTSRCAATAANGTYDLTSLGTGSYDVLFISAGEYAIQIYDKASSLKNATAVPVVAGFKAENIDAALEQEPPSAVTRPSIIGSAAVGQTLTVTHGSWTGTPTSYVDEWGLCGASGQISTCHTVATGESYAVTEADVGHTVRVRESAANAAGKGGLAYSAAVGPVPSPPPPVATPQPAPTGTGGVLGTTSVVLSVPQLRALLAGVLAPEGRDAKIGMLLKRGGYTVSLNAPSSGTLAISWYLLSKGAHAASRPVLAAVGRVSFAKAGVVHLTIKLTSKGRALLRHATHVKLTAKGMLTPSGQSAVSAAVSFTVRR